jgi:hypothetical protein
MTRPSPTKLQQNDCAKRRAARPWIRGGLQFHDQAASDTDSAVHTAIIPIVTADAAFDRIDVADGLGDAATTSDRPS